MNQASQAAVLHEANLKVIDIRSRELTYFTFFFGDMGTNSALMVGFIAGSISQAPGEDRLGDAPYFFIALYWFTSALTCATGIHSLVTTVFTLVYAQGLALRGPSGSMVRAVKGMVDEQKQVLISFLLTVFFFGVQTIGLYWVMYDRKNAIISSVVTALGMILWWRDGVRIYNRFIFDSKDVAEIEGLHKEPGVVEQTACNGELDYVNPTILLALHNRNIQFKDPLNPPEIFTVPLADDSLLNFEPGEQTFANGIDITPQQAIQNHSYGGYLSKRNPTSKSVTSILKMDPWKRVYVVVVQNCALYYYQDRTAFITAPLRPINTRPIMLEEYSLIVGSNEPPFYISFLPSSEESTRENINFRADTLNEFDFWVEKLSTSMN